MACSPISPTETAISSEVFQALDRLPPRERIAWSLRVLEGEPMDTVARLCDCSLATAKRRVGSAQKLIDALVKQ